jgi:hypothetical protein
MQDWHVLRLPLSVEVHVLVAGLQLNVPHAVSLVAVHCTQVPEEQTFLPEICEQSLSL